MKQPLLLQQKEIRAYAILTSLVICGLAGSILTTTKVIYLGANIPFANIVFVTLTFPIVNCICEIWGTQAAKQTLILGLASQILFTLIIQLSIIAPHSPYWHHDTEYQMILSDHILVVFVGLFAFTIAQMANIAIFQRMKEISNGKFLWLRSNFAILVGQSINSSIFVLIVFANSNQKYEMVIGSIIVKMFLTFLMTPFVYLIVTNINRYLESSTKAFKIETETNGLEPMEGI